MASLNKVQLIGNLGRDPEIRFSPDGTPFATLSLATSERWKDKDSGEARESTEWHRVVFSGKLAEIAGEYLIKGSAIYVEGQIKTRKWQDKDGNDKYSTDIRCDKMVMLGGARKDSDDGSEQHSADEYSGVPG